MHSIIGVEFASKLHKIFSLDAKTLFFIQFV